MLDLFGLQFVLSLIELFLISKWYVAPWLAENPANQAGKNYFFTIIKNSNKVMTLCCQGAFINPDAAATNAERHTVASRL
jgi:hypothetical protein